MHNPLTTGVMLDLPPIAGRLSGDQVDQAMLRMESFESSTRFTC